MVEIALPIGTYNIPKLQTELGFGIRTEGQTIYLIVPDETSQAVIDAQLAIAAAHDSTLTIEQDLFDARSNVILQAKEYLNNQLANSNPNIDTIYGTLKTAIDTRPVIRDMLTNQIALLSVVFGWVQGNHTATENKAFYIFCFQTLVATLG